MWQLLLIALVAKVEATHKKCRVLAMGGGSDKGAYTAGVAIGLIQSLPQEESQWDIVTGNGDAALNAYIMGQTAKGDEEAAVKHLQKFWSEFTWSDFYQDWSGWLITGLFYQTGLYDSSNLKGTIEGLDQGEGIKRNFGVGATDLLTGGYAYFDSDNLSPANMKVGIQASASTAGIFPYIEYEDWKLVDGTLSFSVDILHGIDYCNAKGFKDEDIVVYTALSSGKRLKEVDASGYKTLQLFMRYLAIGNYDSTMLVVENARHFHPDVNVKDPIFPSDELPDSIYPFDYASVEFELMLEAGIKDGKAAAAKWFK